MWELQYSTRFKKDLKRYQNQPSKIAQWLIPHISHTCLLVNTKDVLNVTSNQGHISSKLFLTYNLPCRNSPIRSSQV